MTHETPHLDTIITRLEKIERQNHRLKLAGACLLILGSSLLLMGQFSSTPVQSRQNTSHSSIDTGRSAPGWVRSGKVLYCP